MVLDNVLLFLQIFRSQIILNILLQRSPNVKIVSWKPRNYDNMAVNGKHHADLDVLINCAGAVWNERFDDFPDEAFEKVINLNLRRVFQLIQL